MRTGRSDIVPSLQTGWRQGHMKCGASIFVRCSPDAAAVRFYNRVANRQADSHTFLLGCDERLEEPAHDLRRQTGAGIGDRNLDLSGIYKQRPDGELASRNALHR